VVNAAESFTTATLSSMRRRVVRQCAYIESQEFTRIGDVIEYRCREIALGDDSFCGAHKRRRAAE